MKADIPMTPRPVCDYFSRSFGRRSGHAKAGQGCFHIDSEKNDERSWPGHLPEYRKLRNIRNDGRVALSLETGGHNAMGLAEYLVIHGTARVTERGTPQLLQRLAHTYLGPDVRFPPMDNPPPGYMSTVMTYLVERAGDEARGRVRGPRRVVARADSP
jgi:hypothetical protein